MGPKLRKRKNEKGGQTRNCSSPDSSKSSDDEQQKAIEVITRLSQKYLRTRSSTSGTTPPVTCTTSTEKQISSSSGSEYDGDAEYTSDESAKSAEAMSVDAYEFNESDVEEKTTKLSTTSRGAHKSRSRKHRKTANTTKDKENISKRTKKESKKTLNVSPISIKQVKTKSEGKNSKVMSNVPDVVQCTVRMTKIQNEISPIVLASKGNTSVAKGTKRNVDKAGFYEELSPILASSRSFQNEGTNDSGVFISPQPPKKVLKGMAKDTSTPSSCVLRPRSQPIKEKCFGFEVTESPMLSFPSPVSKAESSTSDYVSMEGVPRLSFDDTVMDEDRPSSSPPALFMENENIEEMPVNKSSIHKSYRSSKRKYAKGRYSIGKLEEWANKMNTEFAEIESFELSIEG